MLNRVVLQGRLVADPELRHTQNNIAVATFRLAVDRDFKEKATGQRKADFINVIAWRGTGEFASKYLSKGRMAVVEGKLQSRTWEDKDGGKRYGMDVVADNVYFADSKIPEGQKEEPDFVAPEFSDMDDDGDELPF